MIQALRVARTAVLLGAAILCVLSLASVPAPPPSPGLAPAADTRLFRAGNIVTDAVFYDSGSMSVTQVQGFLNGEGSSCVPAAGGPACLRSYRLSTTTQPADAFCKGQYTGATNEPAASIITKVAIACGINPRVLLVMLQKETGLVARTAPTQHLYDRAMGFGCPDSANGTCSAYYPGLFKQLYFAAKQFKRYAANPTNYGYVPGITNRILYNPNSACGSTSVLIENQATAGLYNYTPYVPNAQALAAGYGSGSSCSSYGNRNFWLYFTDWFGSTQTTGRDVDAPVGSLDSVTTAVSGIVVRGWNFDPNALTTPINAHVYIDGRFVGAIPANQYRPDVGAYYPGVGSAHGFSAPLVAAPGRRNVCVYSVNTGKGYTNPLEGCRLVTVPAFPLHVPLGGITAVSNQVLDVTVTGWELDPDVPRVSGRVHLYVDGRPIAGITPADQRQDIAVAYPTINPAHGFTWTGRLTGGAHQLCLYGINQGAGSTNPKLGCTNVTLGGPPRGSLEQVAPTQGQVEVSGWALDPDTVASITVHVYVDGVRVQAVPADGTRAEIAADYPGYGSAHGFDTTVTVPGGSRAVCAYAINAGSGWNVRLGCQTVTVPGWAPQGNVDGVANGANATYGWALDKDAPTQPVTVDVTVDGTRVTPAAGIVANVPRADIGATFPSAGNNHGWRLTLSPALTSGTHTVCASGRNLGAGSGSAQLACKTVTIP